MEKQYYDKLKVLWELKKWTAESYKISYTPLLSVSQQPNTQLKITENSKPRN